MEVTQEVVEHLAELSNFQFSPQEATKLQQDLQAIVAYISQLNQLDTTNVTPTFQVFEMENVWRSDEIVPQEADREQLLALAPASQDHQIKVPQVL